MRSTRLFLIPLFALMFLGLSYLNPAFSQDPDYELGLNEGSGYTDSTAEIAVTLFSHGSYITGFEFAVCNDSLVDTGIGDVTLGAVINDEAIESISMNFGPDYWSVALVLSAGNFLSVGETHELAIATYELLKEGDSELSFCASVLEPMLTIEGGDKVEPTTYPTAIVITPPPLYLRGDANGDGRVEPLLEAVFLGAWVYDGGTVPPCLEAADANDDASTSFFAGLSDANYLLNYFFEGGGIPSFPGPLTCGSSAGGGDLGCISAAPTCPSDAPVLTADPGVFLSFGKTLDAVMVGEEIVCPVLVTVEGADIQGIQFGVCHSDGIAIPELSPPVSAFEYGEDTQEFDYRGFNQYDSGWVAGMLPSLSDNDAMEPGEHELMRVTYSIETEGVHTIEFCEGLGDPPVDIRAVRDFELLLPELAEPKVIEGMIDVVNGLVLSNEEGTVGETVQMPVLISNLYDHLEAWHFGVCHDDLVSIQDGDVQASHELLAVDMASHTFGYESGGWTVSAVVNLSTGGTLAPGIRQEAYLATYALGDSTGLSTLRFCVSLGDPAVSIRWKTDGVEVEPATYEGSIEVLPAAPYTYAVDAPQIFYDPETFPASIEFSVDLTIREDSNTPGFPNNTVAFIVAIAHDESTLEIEAADFTGIPATLNGGTGPAFAAVEFEDTGAKKGIYAAALYSFVTPIFIQFEETEPVLRVDYAVTSGGLATIESSDAGIITSLEWSNEMGDPPVTNVVVLDNGLDGINSYPDLANGTVRILPEGSVVPSEFLRGDCDGNGTVFALGDALFLLSYGFSGGDSPPCLDAADVDDSGGVVAIIDGLSLLNWQFSGGAAPPDPGTSGCGTDPTSDATECEVASEACL